MSKVIELPYSVLDLENLPNESRLANIATPKTTKKWLMSQVEDFFIFSIKFWAPSKIYYLDIRGNNTYKVDLMFKDSDQNYLCEYSLIFEAPEQNKIIQINEHPLCQYVDVKLLNSTSPMRMGLGYLIFKGKSTSNITEAPASLKARSTISYAKDKKSVFSLREKQVEIDLESHSELVAGQKEAKGVVPQQPNDIYEEEEVRNQQNDKRIEHSQPGVLKPVKKKVNQPVVIDEQSHHEEHVQSHFPYTLQELETEIIDTSEAKIPYVTYPYNPEGQWWKIFEKVNKGWVDGQRNLENLKEIAEEDRMSSKIQVQHLYGKKLMGEGLDLERKNIVQQTARLLGAMILKDVQPGCLVVTTRDYGTKIKNRKKFKNTKLVTEQYVFNCKRFNAHLNEDDYRI